MEKYKTKTTIKKCFLLINLQNLSQAAQLAIQSFDHYSKKLTFDRTLKLFLFAINDEKESLRHIDTSLISPKLQREVGLTSISYSQLSRALKHLPTSVLEEIFTQLLVLVYEKVSLRQSKKWYLIDSTTFPLNKVRYPWANFRQTKSGVKLHLKVCFMDNEHLHPEEFTITNAAIHDSQQLDVLVHDTLATYVFDRGYLDFGKIDQMHWDGYFFVTRIKSNTTVHIVENHEVSTHSQILSDQLVRLGKNNYLTSTFRLVTLERPDKTPLRLITNRMDSSAGEISDMYRSRWQIELFFKHIKQHLTIKTYYSRSEEGVANQIYLAMIAYLLTYLMKLTTKTQKTIFQVLREFRELLFEPVELFWERLIPT